MKVLVACEFSGAVRRAFQARGHLAWSCDLLAADDGSNHHWQTDVMNVIDAEDWDLMIAHPPCTHLSLSGNRWRKSKCPSVIKSALDFAEALWKAPIERIALEQPRSILSRRIGKISQTIHPYEFGIPEFKTTWLWLKGLPKLIPTETLDPPRLGSKRHVEWSRIHRAAPGPKRATERSRTYPEIAAAMAAQWGGVPGFALPPAGCYEHTSAAEPK